MTAAAAAAAARAVPWKDIIKIAIAVATAASDVYNKFRSKPKPAPIDPHAEVRQQIGSVAQRLEALEANELEQGKLIEQMAAQINTLSVAVTRLHIRNIAALSLAGAALTLSLFLLIR